VRRESHLAPCPSPRRCLRRIVRSLCLISIAIYKIALVVLTANEQSVAGEDSTVVSIFEEEADAVLGMARRVQGFHLDVLADREGLAVSGSLVDLVAVLAADDGERVAFEDLCVSASVIMVAVS
jgi:hypothetical protein